VVKRLVIVLGDQLSPRLASLAGATPGDTAIVIAETPSEATYVGHHKKKIAFMFAAMRRFAQELRGRGFGVAYRRFDHGDGARTHGASLAQLVGDGRDGARRAPRAPERFAPIFRGYRASR
jgi:deoxyribodipyrimidine photolyase-related protein